MLYLARTRSSSLSAISWVIEPYSMSFSIVIGVFENLRIVSVGPHRAMGGSTTFTREPSGRRVSQIGLAWLTSRPARPTMRWITSSNRRWLSNCLSSLNRRPFCSMKMFSGPLIITSVMVSSFKMESSRPKPRMELKICSAMETRWSMGQ